MGKRKKKNQRNKTTSPGSPITAPEGTMASSTSGREAPRPDELPLTSRTSVEDAAVGAPVVQAPASSKNADLGCGEDVGNYEGVTVGAEGSTSIHYDTGGVPAFLVVIYFGYLTLAIVYLGKYMTGVF